MIIKWILIILGGAIGLYVLVFGIFLFIDQVIQQRRLYDLKFRIMFDEDEREEEERSEEDK